MVEKSKVVPMFTAAGAQAWRIYEGLRPNTNSARWCAEYNKDTEGEPEQQLDEAISNLLPGTYTLLYTRNEYKRSKPTNNGEETGYNFYKGSMQLSFTIPGNVQPGVNGAIGSGLMGVKEGYVYISKSDIEKERKDAVSAERRFWEMERKLDDMSKSGGIWGEMAKAIIPELPALITAMTGQQPGPRLQAAINGMKAVQASEVHPPTPLKGGAGAQAAPRVASPSEGDTGGDVGESAEQQQAAQELIKASLTKMSKHFETQTAFAQALAKLANKIEANPLVISFL